MSTDDQKVGLIPVTLMVAGNIMGSGVFYYRQIWLLQVELRYGDG